MDRFTRNEIKISSEGEAPGSGEVRVVKLDSGEKPAVDPYRLVKLREPAKERPRETAEESRKESRKERKDKRFSVNPMLRNFLSIEEEERKEIERRVAERIDEISAEARERARAEGYEAGLRKGRDEAFARFSEEGSAKLERLEKLVSGFESWKSEILRTNERFLVEMIFHAFRMVALKELSTDKEYLLRLVRELVERVGVRDGIRLTVHPKDLESVGEIRKSLAESFGDLKNLRIEASEEVSGGGCLLETEWNVIDASVDTQLEGIHAALQGGSRP